MRKVLYKEWIPIKWVVTDIGKAQLPGTGCYGNLEKSGVFHCWGVSYEEFESGPGNYTVAIVQNEDGTISEVLPSKLKFLTP